MCTERIKCGVNLVCTERMNVMKVWGERKSKCNSKRG